MLTNKSIWGKILNIVITILTAIATTFEVVHYIVLQAVHYKPLQEVRKHPIKYTVPNITKAAIKNLPQMNMRAEKSDGDMD